MRPWTLYSARGTQWSVDRPLVMAILNATPDSFSDGGELDDAESLARRVAQVVQEGADILDVGGESTRPGHDAVSVDEEIRRVVPVIEEIRRQDDKIQVSIDSQKPAVAHAALEAGADFVNDVAGLRAPGMRDRVRDAGCSAVVMRRDHLVGDVVSSCKQQLRDLVHGAMDAGIPEEHLIVDPGLGFGSPPGSALDANMALVDGVADYAEGLPVLIGASRKRFIGTMTGQKVPSARVEGSVAVARRAVDAGAAIVRVHDVVDTVAALRPG